MKWLLISALLLVHADALSQELSAEVDTLAEVESSACDCYCHIDPEFPGGSAAMKAYLEKNLIIPASAESLLPVKCYTRFIVAASGHISNVEVVKSVPDCPECEEETLRLIKNMPEWVPEKIQGKPVNSIMHLPVIFVFK